MKQPILRSLLFALATLIPASALAAPSPTTAVAHKKTTKKHKVHHPKKAITAPATTAKPATPK